VLSGLSSFSDALEWPSKGTQFRCRSRNTILSRGETEPWYQWHLLTAMWMLGAVIVDVVRYEDFQTNQYLKEVASGQTHTPAKSTLWQVHLDPKFGKVRQSSQF